MSRISLHGFRAAPGKTNWPSNKNLGSLKSSDAHELSRRRSQRLMYFSVTDCMHNFGTNGRVARTHDKRG